MQIIQAHGLGLLDDPQDVQSTIQGAYGFYTHAVVPKDVWASPNLLPGTTLFAAARAAISAGGNAPQLCPKPAFSITQFHLVKQNEELATKQPF